MKYSYMPTRKFAHQIEPNYMYFESEKQTIIFRNQYNTPYMFAPYKFILVAYCFFLIIGIVIGRYI